MGSEEEVRGERANGFAGRLEVIEGPSGSRSWSDAVKAQIVRESLEPGVTVSEVARCHRISPQHLTLWRGGPCEKVVYWCPSDVTRMVATLRAACRGGRSGRGTILVNDRIVIEVNGVVLTLPAATEASRIALLQNKPLQNRITNISCQPKILWVLDVAYHLSKRRSCSDNRDHLTGHNLRGSLLQDAEACNERRNPP